MASAGSHAAIDRYECPRDMSRVIRREECGDVRHVFWLRDPTQRDGSAKLFEMAFTILRARLDHRRIGVAGADRVHTYALMGVIERH